MMTKNEFKQMFSECFEVKLEVVYTPNYSHTSEYSLQASLVDKETKEEVSKSLVNLGAIRSSR